jgi:hypothetical protein
MGVEVWIRGVVTRDADRDRNFEVMMRDRAPCLLAVARLASNVARELLPEFRASSRGDWLQGLVVGLAVARVAQRRHT